MKPVKFAVVGCGHIGKRHASMILQNPNAELIALCDIKNHHELQLQEFSVPFFQSLDTLLNSGLDYDVLNICTPNSLHIKHALAALHFNKHVVIEKPMGLKAEQCKWVIQKAQEQEKFVFCVMQNRYSPPAKWLKEMIQNNMLGNIYSIIIQCYWNRDERYYHPQTWHGSEQDGGTLFTQFSHFLDLFYWLFGPIKNIQAQFSDFNHKLLTMFEDSGSVQFEFGKNSKGNFIYSTAVYEKNFESSMSIIAEHGTVKIGGQYMDKVSYCNIKNYTLPELDKTNEAQQYGAYSGSAANHHYVIENIVKSLNGLEVPDASAEEGLQVVQMIESIYKLRPQDVLKESKMHD